MPRADVDAATSVGLPSAARRSPSLFLLSLCVIAISASATIGAAQCSAQDVADAARQERARKETEQKKPKHVYTEEDLKRAQILTPEDREQVQAKKTQPVPMPTEKSLDAVDAESIPAGAPLGDVARQVRHQKESQEQRRAQQFTLSLTEAPVLASPKPLIRSLRPKPTLASPVAPSFAKSVPPGVAPFQPPVKRSPFSRPKILMSPRPRALSSEPALPGLSASRLAAPLTPEPPRSHIAATRPPAMIAPSTAAKLSIVTVKRGDSLWKIAQHNLGAGFRWHDLLAVNPDIRDANRIEAGSRIFLPTASPPAATTLTVQRGDSLSKIARARFAHAALWPCIARANPSIADPNLIYEGQTLTMPASCPP